MDRRENNKQVIDSIANDDGNKQHILARLLKRFDLKRKLAVMLKHDRQDKEKAQANIELYLDDWVYQHGPIDYLPSKEHPQGGPVFQNALADCVDRINTLHRRKQQQAEDAEFRKMQGPLGEFEDLTTPMGGLPGNGEIADALCKADPELKKHRKDLI